MNRFALVALALLISACTTTTAHQPLTIQEQGSFTVGGTVVTTPGTFDPIRQSTFTPTPDPAGQTLHGDHAYVFYQLPANARKLPFVFWHGHGQSGKTWETTPDGREGFQTIFLRRRWPVYVIDEPRRGRAGKSAQATGASAHDEQMWFGIIVIYYGDNIPATTTTTPGPEQWRVFLQLARLFRDAANARGGDVTVVHLPEIGIRGNTHFPRSDLNNVQLADHLAQYLAQKGLDR